jgi:hypothetical protein
VDNQETAVEISDEVVEAGCIALEGAEHWQLHSEDLKKEVRISVRNVIQAAIPLVVEGLVKEAFIKGWDACHDRWSGKYVDHNHVDFDLAAFIESKGILAKVKK